MALIITRETDYALRILRALMDGEQHTVGELSERELIPQQFAYKILKKLSQTQFVQVTRGADGGCRLTADLDRASLYDVMAAMDGNMGLSACMTPGYQCLWQEAHGSCSLHCRLAEIQRQLNEALKAKSLREILSGS